MRPQARLLPFPYNQPAKLVRKQENTAALCVKRRVNNMAKNSKLKKIKEDGPKTAKEEEKSWWEKYTLKERTARMKRLAEEERKRREKERQKQEENK